MSAQIHPPTVAQMVLSRFALEDRNADCDFLQFQGKGSHCHALGASDGGLRGGLLTGQVEVS